MRDYFLPCVTVVIVVFLICLVIVAKHDGSRHDEYKTACERIGGVAVFNGKHYECLPTPQADT